LFQVYTVFTPKHAASGAIDYELPVNFVEAKLRFHVDANYAGKQYSFQSEPVKTDSSFIVNGRVALSDLVLNDSGDKMTVALWSRNLLNETHVYRRSAANSSPVIDSITGIPSYSGVLGDYANFNPPRTFGVEASFNMGGRRTVRSEPVADLPLPPPPAATQTCADGSVVLATEACPVAAPPPAPAATPERG